MDPLWKDGQSPTSGLERLSPLSAALILGGCALGFGALLTTPQIVPGWPGRWIGALLFALIPLGGFALAQGKAWVGLLRRPSGRDVAVALAFVPPTFILPGAIAYLVLGRDLTVANPAAAMLPQMSAGELAGFLASTLPQLLGEELITILPFLVIVTALRGRVPRLAAIAIAALATALIFGALHLPTYQWRLFNALVIIGLARLSLTASFVVTGKLWASVITHVVNDWLLFGLVLGLASLKA